MKEPRPEIDIQLVPTQYPRGSVPCTVLAAAGRIKRCYQQSIHPSLTVHIGHEHVRTLSIGDLKLVTDFIESQDNA